MSFKTGLAAVFGIAGMKAPLSLAGELKAAVENNNPAGIATIAALSPELVTGNTGMKYLEDAVIMGNRAAAEALVVANPQLPTTGDSNNANLLMRHSRAPASQQSYELLLSLYKPEELLQTDKHGNTVLHYAAREEGEPQLDSFPRPFTPIALTALSAFKLDANARNDRGETPIMGLGMWGGTKGLEILLSQGAELNAADKAGKNAAMHAIEGSNLDTAAALMDRGGLVDFKNASVETQARVASYEVNLDFLKALENRRKIQEGGAQAPGAKAQAPTLS